MIVINSKHSSNPSINDQKRSFNNLINNGDYLHRNNCDLTINQRLEVSKSKTGKITSKF